MSQRVFVPVRICKVCGYVIRMPGRQECYLCDDSALVSGLPDVGNRRVFCVREVRRTVTGIGTRVGKLTVAADSGQRKSGYIVWRCRCDCGGEILLDTRCLQRGKVTDCGCTTNVNNRQRDITGMRFGKLTAICPTQGRGRRRGTVWLCRCDCGREVLAELGQLTSGYRRSCGCLSHPAPKDLAGRRFGRLTVTGYAGKEKGMHRWRCDCDCGKETIVGQSLLLRGRTKSCGCLQASMYKENLQLTEGTSVVVLRAVKGGRLIRSNTSGHNGVYFNKKTGKWAAQITFQGKTKYLGQFWKLEDAVLARQRGEELFDDFLERQDAAGDENGAGGGQEEPPELVDIDDQEVPLANPNVGGDGTIAGNVRIC